MPATPSTATCAPSGILSVASRTPSTIGIPRSRASDARCEVEPPSSATTPATRGRIWLSAGPRHSGHQDIAWPDAGELALAIHHHGAAGTPADPSRMAAETRMLQPDVIRHQGGLQVQGAGLQQLEAGIVERPLDLHRHAVE